MKVRTLFILLNLLFCQWVVAQQTVSSGKLIEYPKFKSSFITPRDVFVWLPSDYSAKKKYDVVYMHDGQMLFDATTTWNKEEWGVDEVVGKLLDEKKIKPCIVVGIANIPETRYEDYFPQKALKYLPDGSLPQNVRFNADNYLRFLVEEVKPFIDKEYSTNKGVEHTFVMGSSMGGLISLYAICEYPGIFGGAACLSTHVVMIASGDGASEEQVNQWATAFRGYLEENLPKANSRMIYMDRGDATLDAYYPIYQDELDKLMKKKGWDEPMWLSKVFPGAGHIEGDWMKRLDNPLQFLLGNERMEKVEKVDPAFWWCGMKNTQLQLMVYGNNIATYNPVINHPGVVLKSVHPMESPNYLILYLDLKDAQPGKFSIDFVKGENKLKYVYELKERQGKGEDKIGFNSSDVVYLLMPDRFANGDESNDRIQMKYPYTVNRKDVNARHGGDLAGIVQHLDYLDSLGITTVWTTPVLENDMGEGSYHGYAATDYYKIDPRLGTNEEYAHLAEAMHQRGMKLIMDMVFNHCGSNHPWLLDLPMRNWFNNPYKYVQTNHNKTVFFDPYASDADKLEMTDGWFVPTMPDLNQRNRYVADYLIQNSIWWIEYANLDGIRQDTYPYPDGEMMARWCKEVLEEYPNLNIVGEVMITNPTGTAYWQQKSAFNKQADTRLKSVMDFHLQSIASKAFHEETSWNTGLQLIFEHMAYDFCYPDINNVMRLLENHDTDRFLLEAPENLNAYKQAVTLLLTIPGIPQLYYGQELLMTGNTKIDFGYIRPDMTGGWKEDTSSLFEAGGRTAMQQEAFNFMKNLLQWRKGNEVISKGKMKHFMPRNNVYVYERLYNGKSILVVMNGVNKEVDLDLIHYKEVIGDKSNSRNVLTNSNLQLGKTLHLQPKEVLVLEL